MTDRARYDIVLVSDFRFPGGTSASMAQEIRAQAAAGYSTALVQLPTSLLKRPRPINSKIQRCVIEGLADLVVPDTPLDARLLVCRHPVVFTERPVVTLDIVAEHKVMVVNQAPFDATETEPFYDVPAAAAMIRELFGDGFVWTPIGPIVRDAFEQVAQGLDLLDWDWHNILDPEEWEVRRTGFVGDRPVLGRHSRPHYRKWPETREAILAAYPDDPAVEVRVLGGAEVPQRILGRIPDNWTVLPFGATSAARFLADLDFFVYFHHPGLNEAFGRAILEALATGAVVIIPAHFRRLFGDSCRYGEATDVRRIVDELHADPEAFLEQSRRGQAFVREHFSHDTHVRRIASFIGEPEHGTPTPLVRQAKPRTRLLFMTSNGGGLGHITRMLALARRARDDFQPLFFTLSQSFGFVRDQGFPVEFCPSRDYSHLSREGWSMLFEQRFRAVIETHRPSAVVFDGTNPYPGIGAVHEVYPDIPFVWSRRGMWKPGMGADNLTRVDYFDHVLAPGDFCDEIDGGLTITTADPIPCTDVPPITMLDEDELVPRVDAAAALGLDPGRPAVLVQLADPDGDRLARTLEQVVERLGREEGLQLCVPQSITLGRATLERHDLVSPRIYPLSRYLRAFDFAVSATGYNTFHELVAFKVPAIYVPKPETSLDDQDGRARYAEQVGVGLCVERFDAGAFDKALTRMMDPGERARMVAELERRATGNGARQAVAVVEALAAGAPLPTTEAEPAETGASA